MSLKKRCYKTESNKYNTFIFDFKEDYIEYLTSNILNEKDMESGLINKGTFLTAVDLSYSNYIAKLTEYINGNIFGRL